MRTSAIIPAALMGAINARLETDAEGNPTGFGPGNFSVPLHSGADATHAGLSCGNVVGFLDLLLELEASGDFPGLVVDYEGKPTGAGEPASRADFGQMVAAQALEPFDGIPENLPQKDDERTFGGKTWVSLIDNNVWQPPVGWREVVADGPPSWVQPTSAVDAYAIGERVTHPNAQAGGAVWVFESNIIGNTTEPGTDGTFHRWWRPIEAVA